ncbi:hypothetical protein VNO80_00349 [Phaseolus coccineus]|uniref:Uncharacterized protein n=1 Tax=Phaseolus coccineus TaxID=3886 RepID=A0AAN9P2M1_PHACN
MCNNPSSQLVGSSRKSNLGLIKISKAMLTLLFSPPLVLRKCQFPIIVSAQSCSPIVTMVLSTNALLSVHGKLSGKRKRAEYDLVSCTVMHHITNRGTYLRFAEKRFRGGAVEAKFQWCAVMEMRVKRREDGNDSCFHHSMPFSCT